MYVRNSFKLSYPLLYFFRAAIYPCFLANKSTYFLSSCVSILTCALSSFIFYSAISLASTAVVTARAVSSFLRVAIC
jgi:threonine/homoserine/homoserine lactone efflux protein